MKKMAISRILAFLLASWPLLAQPREYAEGFIASFDGVELYFRKAGRGEQVVIMPGRLFFFDDFRWLAEEGFTLISYDMRNRGRSDALDDPVRVTIEADVADLEAVRGHFRAPRVHLIGYSYLGLMIVLYALEHPQRVDRLVQLGPVPLKFGTEYPEEHRAEFQIDPGVRARLLARREEQDHINQPQDYCREEWNTLLRPMLVGDPAKVDRLPSGDFICSMPNEWPVNLQRHLDYHFVGSVQKLEVARSRIEALEVPTLTIHGRLDRNAPFGAGREWVQMLPSARLLSLEGAAHQAFAEHPDRVRHAILTFLRGDWPQQATEVPD